MNKGWGTLREVESEWSFQDLMNAHEALNEIEAAERRAQEDAASRRK